MSEVKVHKVKAAWEEERADRRRDLSEMVIANSVKDPEKFWGQARQAHRLVQALYEGEETPPSRARSRSNGSRTASPTSRIIASTAT